MSRKSFDFVNCLIRLAFIPLWIGSTLVIQGIFVLGTGIESVYDFRDTGFEILFISIVSGVCLAVCLRSVITLSIVCGGAFLLALIMFAALYTWAIFATR